jgi:ubiquinone/menaquinone biosynthesis C-methylase UbiE
MSAEMSRPKSGLLGDTSARDYSAKLLQFNAFAAPELQQLIASLELRVGMRVLDAGCGTGDALLWLAQWVGTEGQIVGTELAAAHARITRDRVPPHVSVLQADLQHLPLAAASFDVIWCANTLHHLRAPVAGLRHLVSLLRPDGRIALVQSALVPEMVFAWDSRLERKVAAAVRRYYQHRYGVSERDIGSVRNMVGVLRQAGLVHVQAHSLLVERISPLSIADYAYLTETIFRNTWGERLKPYLDHDDYAQLQHYCDPADPAFVLARPDFHYLQSLTMVTGQRMCPSQA